MKCIEVDGLASRPDEVHGAATMTVFSFGKCVPGTRVLQ